ncbi:MAG: PAS domain-containing sensor histidine kinase [Actinomycetota bacterium]|nr:PAS domain-containing sensor histidine kinase [Actinomycetota bacterium]
MDLRRREPQPLVGIGLGLAVVVAITLGLLPFRAHVSRATPALVLVLSVVVAGVFGGRLAAVATAVAGAVAFSLAFIPPVGTLRVAVSDDAVALVVFLAVAITIGTLVALEEDRRRAAEQRAAEIEAMHARNQVLEVEQQRLRLEADRLAVLEQVDAQRSALLRSVSHDLRTPLASIRAVASDLRDGAPHAASIQDELLGLVCDEAERLDRIVANLLSLSRIENGALQPDRQAVALDELLSELSKRLDRVFHDVALEVAVPATLPLVDIDYVQMDQVLTNLLENAARHSPPGSTVTVTAEPAGPMVAVAVSDQGPGIDPSEAEHIFEPFRTAGGSASTGVGLAICKAIVEAHGGMISLDSHPGRGARFCLTVPVRNG